jgi:hypothetical protein
MTSLISPSLRKGEFYGKELLIMYMLRKAFNYWIPLALIGVLNGIFRGFVLMEFAGEFEARQISSVLMVIWIIIYAKTVHPFLGVKSSAHALAVGGLWMFFTVVFEFGLGILTQVSFHTLFSDYDLRSGNLWGLVVLSILLMPILIHFEEAFENRNMHHL